MVCFFINGEATVKGTWQKLCSSVGLKFACFMCGDVAVDHTWYCHRLKQAASRVRALGGVCTVCNGEVWASTMHGFFSGVELLDIEKLDSTGSTFSFTDVAGVVEPWSLMPSVSTAWTRLAKCLLLFLPPFTLGGCPLHCCSKWKHIAQSGTLTVQSNSVQMHLDASTINVSPYFSQGCFWCLAQCFQPSQLPVAISGVFQSAVLWNIYSVEEVYLCCIITAQYSLFASCVMVPPWSSCTCIVHTLHMRLRLWMWNCSVCTVSSITKIIATEVLHISMEIANVSNSRLSKSWKRKWTFLLNASTQNHQISNTQN